MITAAGSGGTGGDGSKYARSIMENKVIQNVRVLSGNKSLFRQWHQKYTTAFGQVGGAHVEIVHPLVEKIDLGREMGKVVTGLTGECGDEVDTKCRKTCGTL